MAVIDQKEYLKRYLSVDEQKPKKKRKKKKLPVVKRTMVIVDDDVDIRSLAPAAETVEAVEEELYDDAPTVAGVVDERPEEEKRVEAYRESTKWKGLSNDDSTTVRNGSTGKVDNQEDDLSPVRSRKRHDSDSDLSPERSKQRTNVGRDASQVDSGRKRHDSDSDLSPKRSKQATKIDRDASSGSKGRKRHDSDSDLSPQRTKKRHDSDSVLSPSRSKQVIKTGRDTSSSSRGRKRHDSDIDQSPERTKKRHDSDSDLSPPRSKKNSKSGGLAPERTKNRHDSDSDLSPPRTKRRHDSDSDLSPPRGRRKDGSDSDLSPVRMKKTGGSDSDLSPVRRPRGDPGVNSDSDLSPPRRDTDGKMKKTLSGHRAGLQDAKTLKAENEANRRRQDRLFEALGAEDSGRHKATIFRDKSGKKRDLAQEKQKAEEEEAKKAKENEKFIEWGKGVAQKQIQAQLVQDAAKEMDKPLARYDNDKDLDAFLKEQEREGDPMLAMIRKKKSKEMEQAGIKEKPKYRGPAPQPNRFGIPPGYRWDGVDRSNGFEKKYFARTANKKAMEEVKYKWSVEDM